MDATGAGDLYAAGFLYGFTRGMPIEHCGRLGSLSLGGHHPRRSTTAGAAEHAHSRPHAVGHRESPNTLDDVSLDKLTVLGSTVREAIDHVEVFLRRPT